MTQNGFTEPRHTSTGTTIVGVKWKNGVILGADTRATAGPIVADKNCEKIHYIAPNIWYYPVFAPLTSRCAGAGTAADTDFTTSLISSNLALHSLSTGRTPRVITAVTELKQYLFRHQGHIGAYLIVAGVDPTGTHLFGCQAHGSTDKLPYMTLGSGSLAAMGVLETDFRMGMEKEEAMDLVCRAVLAGIWNDLGSGGSVDLVVMEKDQVSSFYALANFSPLKLCVLILHPIHLLSNNSLIGLHLGLLKSLRKVSYASLWWMERLLKL